MEDYQGIQEADVVANLGAAEHVIHEPSADWLHWEFAAKTVRHSCVRGRMPGRVSGSSSKTFRLCCQQK
eukprot:6195191-Amphidinium_carterae.2